MNNTAHSANTPKRSFISLGLPEPGPNLQATLFPYVIAIIGAVILSGLTGCGKNGLNVESVTVTSPTIENDRYVDVTLNYSLLGTTLPSIQANLPFETGSISMNGTNAIELKLNIDRLAQIEPTNALLPNGGVLPIDLTNAETIDLLIPKTKSHIYFASGPNALAVGFAFSISAFDNLGATLGTNSIFLPITVSGFDIATGIFTSTTKSQSGIALFLDVSGAIPDLAIRSERRIANPILKTQSTLTKRHLKVLQEAEGVLQKTPRLKLN